MCMRARLQTLCLCVFAYSIFPTGNICVTVLGHNGLPCGLQTVQLCDYLR